MDTTTNPQPPPINWSKLDRDLRAKDTLPTAGSGVTLPDSIVAVAR